MDQKLKRVTPESVGIPSQAIIHLLDALEDSTLTDIHSLMISRYGKVCAEGWWQPYAPGLAHATWSLSKTYTATAVGVAIKEGIIGLDERMIDIFPEVSPKQPATLLQQMTVRNLLRMSSGVEIEVFGCNEDWLETFMHSDIAYTPGSGFSYVSQGTNALGQAVAKRSGMTFQKYLEKKILKKLGICCENTSWMKVPDGSELAAGGFHCTTEDSLRLMLLYMQGGRWNGEQLLDEAYVEEATSVMIDNKKRYDHMPSTGKPSRNGQSGYGYQIWIHNYPGCYCGQGAQGQYALVFEREQIVISMTQITNPNYNDPDKIFDLIVEVVKESVENPLPENPEVFNRLKNRLRRLSIPAPVCVAYSPTQDQLAGRQYHTKGGRFTFYPAFEAREHRDTGRLVTKGVDRISFAFSANHRLCTIRFSEDGIDRRLTAAMDGTRYFNILENPNQLAKEVLLNAFWEGDKTLIIQARWVETTVEKTLRFTFEGGRIAINTELTLGTMGAFKQPPDEADLFL